MADEKLQRLIEAWPQLSEAERWEIWQASLDGLPEDKRREAQNDLSRRVFQNVLPVFVVVPPTTEQRKTKCNGKKGK